MKVEMLGEGKDWIKIKISGINYSIANAIRRSSYEIYMSAIDELEIYTNDSVLYDEIIANRLGLIPIIPNRDINPRDICSCKGKGCKKCTLKVKLEAKGKGMIYAKQIQGEAKALFPNIPIVWLEDGQELRLVATITLGKAIEHAKYQAGLLSYNPCFKLVNFNKSFIEGNEEIKKIFEKFNIPLEKDLEIDEKQYEVLDWIKENYEDAKIQLEMSETDFIFYIETYSYLKPIEIFIKSIESLDDNLAKFVKVIK